MPPLFPPDVYPSMVRSLNDPAGSLDDLDQALAAGVDVNGRVILPVDDKGVEIDTFPLLLALLRDKDDRWIQRLLAAGADPNRSDNAARSPLVESVRRNRGTTIALLLQAGADTTVEYGGYLRVQSILHIAVRDEAREAAVRALVDGGMPVDLRDSVGDTPLHCAAWNRQIANVRTLMDLGADPLVQNRHGETPMALIADLTDHADYDMVRRLLENAELRAAVPDPKDREPCSRPRL